MAEESQDTKLAKAPIQLDASNNIVFNDLGNLRRWAEQRIAAGGLPQFIKNAAIFESVYHLLADLGLPAMACIGQTCLINGVTGIWGDLPQAVCERTGELQDLELWLINDKNERQDPEKPFGFKVAGAVCKVTRKGRTPVVRSFTTDQAQAAGLLGKPGPWKQYTDIMLGHRARGYALRAAFPDALKGVKIRESDEYVEVLSDSGTPLRNADGGTLVERARSKASQFMPQKNNYMGTQESAQSEIARQKMIANVLKEGEETDRKCADILSGQASKIAASMAEVQKKQSDDYMDAFERASAKIRAEREAGGGDE